MMLHFNFANEDEFDKIAFENQNARLMFEHYIITNHITDFYIQANKPFLDVITEKIALSYDLTGQYVGGECLTC